MANECLVTKLKGVVNNENLIRLGSIKLYAREVSNITLPSAQHALQLSVNDNVTIIPKGNGKVATSVENLVNNPLSSYTVTPSMGTTNVYFTNGNYTIEITNKKAIVIFGTPWVPGGDDLSITRIVHADVNEMKSMTSLSFLDFNHGEIEGNIENLPPNMNRISCPNSKIYGPIDKINSFNINKNNINMFSVPGLSGDIGVFIQNTNKNFDTLNFAQTNITGDIGILSQCQLNTFSLTNTSVYGDISAIADKTDLTGTIGLGNTNVSGIIGSLSRITNVSIIDVRNTNVSGALETLLTAYYASGRTATFTIYSEGTQITLNNVERNESYSVYFRNGNCEVCGFTTGDLLATYNGATWTYTF